MLAELVQQDADGKEKSTSSKGISRSNRAEKRKEETWKGLKNNSRDKKEKEVNISLLRVVVVFSSEYRNCSILFQVFSSFPRTVLHFIIIFIYGIHAIHIICCTLHVHDIHALHIT